jgi:uncharacterized protein
MDDALVAAAPASHVRKRGARWLISRALIVVVGTYAAWCAILYGYQDHIVFPADAAPQPLAVRDPHAIVTTLQVDGVGSIESWFFPAPGVSAERPGPVAIFCHGNCEIIDYKDDIVRAYHSIGCSVLLPEYRGYGRSAGKPSQAAITADLLRFHDELMKRPEVDRSRVVIHGVSLGGGVAGQLAGQREPRALILESTFTSVAAMAGKYWAPSFLATSPFHTDRVLPNLHCPVLLFHGTRDHVIPVAHGRRLHELAPGSRYFEYDCDHNDFPGRGNAAAYWGEVTKFLRDAGVAQ